MHGMLGQLSINRWLQAFASLMGALAQQPAHVEALLACADLHKACGLLHDAAACLKSAQSAAPDNSAVCKELAAVLTDIGKQRRAAFCQPVRATS